MNKDLCLVSATDSKFFYQFQQCLASIRQWQLPYSTDFKVLAIGLDPEQIAWLSAEGLQVVTDLSIFPRFASGPEHYVAMTCRPYIPDVFPGYRGYIWIDSDIRFLLPEGLRFYADHMLNQDKSIVICHETEPAYSFNSDPNWCVIYHQSTYRRISEEFGAEIAAHFQYYNMHNAGLFAARADSPIWARYKRNLEISMKAGPHWGREQDAMNVSLIEVGNVLQAPTTHNWLCGYSTPSWNAGISAWVSPNEPNRKIAVAHLTNSNKVVTVNNQSMSMYDYYKTIGLTK